MFAAFALGACVYVSLFDFRMACLDAHSGSVIWEVTLPVAAPTALVVVDGRLHFNTLSCVCALDAGTGEVLFWRDKALPAFFSPGCAFEGYSYTGVENRLEICSLMDGSPVGSLPIPDVLGPPMVFDGRHAKDWWTEAGGTDQVVDAYQVSIIQMAGMFVAIYLVQVLLRMRVDETGGTLEPVLASGVTRTRWLRGHLLVAVAGCVALMGLFAVSMGLTAGQVLGDAGTPVLDLVWAGLVQVPGIVVVGAAVAAVVCLVPRWSVPASWAILLSALVVGPMFGPGLNLPPLGAVPLAVHPQPKAPAATVTAAPMLALTAVCIALAVGALVSLRHRDLALPA